MNKPRQGQSAAEPSEVELTPGQQLAITALASGLSYSEAAEAAGVGRRTLFEWRQLPGFAAALRDELQALRDAAGARLLGLAGRAIDSLEKVLAGDNHPAVVNAAKAGTSTHEGKIFLVDSDRAVEVLRQRRMREMKEKEHRNGNA
jgi:hypothetical protein